MFPAGADRRSGDVVGQRGLAWFLKALLELPSAPSPETFHSSSASFLNIGFLVTDLDIVSTVGFSAGAVRVCQAVIGYKLAVMSQII